MGKKVWKSFEESVAYHGSLEKAMDELNKDVARYQKEKCNPFSNASVRNLKKRQNGVEKK